jgi:hypothetical protein
MKNNKLSLSTLSTLIDRFFDWAVDHPVLVASVSTLTPVLLIVGIVIGLNYTFGVQGFGPEKEMVIQVQRLYVDSGSSSHYMVGTDQGVLEVQNRLIPFQMFNSDEVYSQLEVGKTYQVTVKGNKVLNWWYQEYPYIIKIH